MGTVRFFHIAGHFCQYFFGRNSNINSKAEPGADIFSDIRRRFQRRGKTPCDRSEIQITFVNGDLFDIRSQGVEIVHESSAVLFVNFMIRRLQDQVRTFSQSGGHRLSCADAVFLCGNGFGQHYTVAAFFIAADNRRNSAQIQRIPFFQFFQCAPA